MSLLRKNDEKGFTLIELLVVIAIIAILAAILFPVFAKAKETAQLTTCVNNMKQWSTAMQSYVDNYNGYFPCAGVNLQYKHTPKDRFGGGDGGSVTCYDALAKYTAKSEKIKWCPVSVARSPWIKQWGWSYWYFCDKCSTFPEAELCKHAMSEVVTSKKPFIIEPNDCHAGTDNGSTKYNIAYCDGHVKSWALKAGNQKERIYYGWVKRNGQHQ